MVVVVVGPFVAGCLSSCRLLPCLPRALTIALSVSSLPPLCRCHKSAPFARVDRSSPSPSYSLSCLFGSCLLAPALVGARSGPIRSIAVRRHSGTLSAPRASSRRRFRCGPRRCKSQGSLHCLCCRRLPMHRPVMPSLSKRNRRLIIDNSSQWADSDRSMNLKP